MEFTALFERRMYEPRLTGIASIGAHRVSNGRKGHSDCRTLKQLRDLFDSVAAGKRIDWVMVLLCNKPERDQ